MSSWQGFAPADPIASIADYAQNLSPTVSGGQTTNPWVDSDTGIEVDWWRADNGHGVTFEPTDCQGARCYDLAPCQNCEPAPTVTELCFEDVPTPVTFLPFYVYKGNAACGIADPIIRRRWARLTASLNAMQTTQVAGRFSQELADRATNLSGTSASSPSEGIGALLRARATLGLHSATLVVPLYAVPRLESLRLIRNVGGRYVGPGNTRVIVDPGIRSLGPGGATVEAGAAWIYVLDQPPVFAIHPTTDPFPTGGGLPSFEDLVRVFAACNVDMAGLASDCPLNFWQRRRAIVAHNPCASFAVAIDVRDETPSILAVT